MKKKKTTLRKCKGPGKKRGEYSSAQIYAEKEPKLKMSSAAYKIMWKNSVMKSVHVLTAF